MCVLYRSVPWGVRVCAMWERAMGCACVCCVGACQGAMRVFAVRECAVGRACVLCGSMPWGVHVCAMWKLAMGRACVCCVGACLGGVCVCVLCRSVLGGMHGVRCVCTCMCLHALA